MIFIQVFLGIVALYIIPKFISKLCNWYSNCRTTPNPFQKDSRLPIKAKVLDQKLRNLVLKQSFKYEKVPTNLDAIFIGSGIGAMATAAILSKTGKKVLILEQHDKAGGATHTFTDKGYEFDIGIHYCGEMYPQELNRTMMDQISDGQIEWSNLDENHDVIVFKEGENVEEFSVFSNIQKQKIYLKKKFPQDGKVIDRFYELLTAVDADIRMLLLSIKFIPISILNILDFLGIINFVTNWKRFNILTKTITEVIFNLTKNPTLRDLFTYSYFDYGTIPSEASFTIHALLMTHIIKGPSYPVGGASEIAYNIIPVIEKNGSKVLVNAEVTNILINSEGKAYGVKVKRDNKEEYEILAPMIISDTGLYNTMEILLPATVAKNSRLYPCLQQEKERQPVGTMSIFIGLDVPENELDIPKNKNIFVFTERNIDQAIRNYLALSAEEVEIKDPPMQFVSLSSSKDPLWKKKYPGKSTLVIIPVVNYNWFQQWENKPSMKRGNEYESLKKTIGQRSIDLVCQLYPTIKDHIDYVDIGTPLSNSHYLRSAKGEICGLYHNVDRYTFPNCSILRPETDIPGLYLTGQDISSTGLVGALLGGYLCAKQILDRDVMADITKLHTKLTNKKQKYQ